MAVSLQPWRHISQALRELWQWINSFSTVMNSFQKSGNVCFKRKIT